MALEGVDKCESVLGQSSNHNNGHNKEFILSDLYAMPLQSNNETEPNGNSNSFCYGRCNSVVNISFTVKTNYCKRFHHDKLIRWKPHFDNAFSLVNTPCEGLSYVYSEIDQKLLELSSKMTSSKFSHFTNLDHILLAIEHEKLDSFVSFHTEKLGFDRVLISSKETESSGMRVEASEGEGIRLKAMDFTKCSELALHEHNLKTKIILADSLNPQGSNQICEFIRNNGNHSGVQHISLHTDDIVSTCEDLKLRGVKFLNVPKQYYKDAQWRNYVESLNFCPDQLEQNSLLLDYDDTSDEPSYLLQVFTEPIFPNERTFFLEVIQRIGSIRGFGENNIRSLWNAVKMEQEKSRRLKTAAC